MALQAILVVQPAPAVTPYFNAGIRKNCKACCCGLDPTREPVPLSIPLLLWPARGGARPCSQAAQAAMLALPEHDVHSVPNSLALQRHL